MTSEESVQEAIIEDLKAALVEEVYESRYVEAQHLKKTSRGDLIPFYIVDFGDLGQNGARSFVGPRGDDYEIPIYTQAVAGNPRRARLLANKLNDILLGNGYAWSGQVRKRMGGGGSLPVNVSSDATEGYATPRTFAVTIQYTDA
jgi:hypothetical protein